MNSPRYPTLSPSIKMADLLDTHMAVTGVFSRMGLPYGFGEATVGEVCAAHGVDPGAFLLICRVYSQEGYRPSDEELDQVNLLDVVKYLRLSHKYYMEVGLKTLGALLERMSLPCDSRSREILKRFFYDYREELSRHFEYEEEKVFPYVESVLSGARAAPFTADEFSHAHESAEEKLEDLKSLVVKYMPPECNREDLSLTVLYLYTLGQDVQKHIQLEDTILAPLLSPRERRVLESRTEPESVPADPLSQREKEILVCVARGMLNKEIADCFHISIYTVITHRKNITRKIGIKTVAGLTVYALLNNLIDINTVE